MAFSIGKSKEQVKKEKREKQELRDRAMRKKCRESKPDQKTCNNCSMPDKCATEGTQDWLKEENGDS